MSFYLIYLQLQSNMDRSIPIFNRIVAQKIQQKNMQNHYQNLFNIQHGKRLRTQSSSIAKTNLKKEQLTEERNTEIDKKNVILFQKMNRIMKRPDPLNTANINIKIHSRRFANHVQRINQENQQFLQRLCNSKPTINNKKILEQRQKQLLLLKSMGRGSYHGRPDKADSIHLSKRSQILSYHQDFAPIQPRLRKEMQESVPLGKYSSSFMLPMNARPRYSQGDQIGNSELEQAQSYFKREMLKLQQRRKKIQSSISQCKQQQVVHSLSKQKQRSERILKKDSKFENKSIVLFATFKRMNEIIYKVEIHRKHGGYEILCVQIDSSIHKFVTTLEEVQGNLLLSSLDYDYQTLVDNLQIIQRKILINIQKIPKRSQQYPDGPMPPQFKMRIKTPQNINPSQITQQSLEQQQSTDLIPQNTPSQQKNWISIHNK